MTSIVAMTLCGILIFFAQEEYHGENADRIRDAEEQRAESWIVKFQGEPPSAFYATSEIIREMEEMDVYVARPKAGFPWDEWLKSWEDAPQVQYIHPNKEIHISAAPNDPLIHLQNYIQEIGAHAVWESGGFVREVIVAVVDTGVDLNHPDLKPNLVPGINLMNPGVGPWDDNGHGTNVAGIIAAVANNNEGIAGIGRKVKIMPIKALNGDGSGSEDKLGEGIRYAVDNGADVVVLSLGLYHYSPFMQEIVDYAEKKGTLLIAAAGNEGREVKYPAAYPTVLAVGGMTKNGADPRSNRGPEIDVVAPWRVFTTALGGGYAYNEGTSMSAPQVAAAAALVLSKYPELKPVQVRNMLRQTAQDIGAPGWDPETGYGLLRVDRLLAAGMMEDIYEPNERANQAKPLPLQSMTAARLDNAADQDWFVVDVPYDGKLELHIRNESGSAAKVLLLHRTAPNVQGTVHNASENGVFRLNVKKGKHYIRITGSASALLPMRYTIVPIFHIFADSFEDNNQMYKAYRLPVRNQEIRGTFHQKDDEDWYELYFTEAGNLRLKLSMDTTRIDGVLTLVRQGEKPVNIDEFGEGEPEYHSTQVLPGKYYVRVKNVHAHPVTGTYRLSLEFTPRFKDPHEPNDKAYQSVSLTGGYTYRGVFHSAMDEDWFKFSVKKDSVMEFSLKNIPPQRTISITLMDEKQNHLITRINKAGNTAMRFDQRLSPGTYYVRLTTDGAFEHQTYHLRIDISELVEGFKDIGGHWAREYIAELSRRKWVEGYGNYRFDPDRPILRAEAAVIISTALDLNRTVRTNYRDVPSSHWAYPYISRATAAGIMEGYGNRTFAPNRPVTRMEMAVILANALHISGSPFGSVPFKDVQPTYWGTPILRALKERKLIGGYGDGTYRPDHYATRAEFAVLIYHLTRR